MPGRDLPRAKFFMSNNANKNKSNNNNNINNINSNNKTIVIL